MGTPLEAIPEKSQHSKSFDRLYMLVRHGAVAHDNELPPECQKLDQKGKQSIRTIAKTLGISTRTVMKYRSYQ